MGDKLQDSRTEVGKTGLEKILRVRRLIYFFLKMMTFSSVQSLIEDINNMFMRVKRLQLCLTLCNTAGCNPPDSSVHRILQARMLEWVAMPSSRESS